MVDNETKAPANLRSGPDRALGLITAIYAQGLVAKGNAGNAGNFDSAPSWRPTGYGVDSPSTRRRSLTYTFAYNYVGKQQNRNCVYVSINARALFSKRHMITKRPIKLTPIVYCACRFVFCSAVKLSLLIVALLMGKHFNE